MPNLDECTWATYSGVSCPLFQGIFAYQIATDNQRLAYAKHEAKTGNEYNKPYWQQWLNYQNHENNQPNATPDQHYPRGKLFEP